MARAGPVVEVWPSTMTNPGTAALLNGTLPLDPSEHPPAGGFLMMIPPVHAGKLVAGAEVRLVVVGDRDDGAVLGDVAGQRRVRGHIGRGMRCAANRDVRDAGVDEGLVAGVREID